MSCLRPRHFHRQPEEEEEDDDDDDDGGFSLHYYPRAIPSFVVFIVAKGDGRILWQD